MIAPPPVRHEFTFEQPVGAAAERRALLEAVMEYHPIDDKDQDQKPQTEEDKVGSTSIPSRRKRRVKAETRFFLNHHVATLGTLTLAQAHRLIHGVGARRRHLEKRLPNKPLRVELVYPLSKGVELEIAPFRVVDFYADGRKEERDEMSIGYFLWAIAQEYYRIYKQWKRYKVWGHELEDLKFERMEIFRGGRVDLLVGS